MPPCQAHSFLSDCSTRIVNVSTTLIPLFLFLNPNQIVHFNSLLATLNNREALRERLGGVVISDLTRNGVNPVSDLRFKVRFSLTFLTSDVPKLNAAFGHLQHMVQLDISGAEVSVGLQRGK